MEIDSKVAIVTGAGSGLGKQLALSLLEKGAKVVLAGRREGRLNQTIKESVNPKNARSVVTDLTVLTDLKNLVDYSIKEFNSIDILVNNAGTGFGGDLSDLQIEEIEYTIRLNLTAPILLTKLVLPTMRKNRQSMIVNIASLGAVVATPYHSIYCASKSGLHGFSGSLRRQFKNDKIKVLTVYPGMIDTEMACTAAKEKAKQVGLPFELSSPQKVAQQIIKGIVLDKSNLYSESLKEKVLRKSESYIPFLTDSMLSNLAGNLHEVFQVSNPYFSNRMKIK